MLELTMFLRFFQHFLGKLAYFRGKSDIDTYLEQVELQGKRARSEIVTLGWLWYTVNVVRLIYLIIIVQSKTQNMPRLSMNADQ